MREQNETRTDPTHIEVRGAREHNLQDIDVDIPRGKLVVVCGVSGSGKSTLAFDTVYAEGQRRYVESLSAYARQFLGQLKKPDVDSIDGLSPAVAIDQKTTSANPRSTVGTVTEIHDHLRLLWARVGVAHCPEDGERLGGGGVQSTVKRLLEEHDGAKILVGASVVRQKKGTMKSELDAVRRKGYVRVRVDGRLHALDEADPELDKNLRHDVDVIVDRLVVKEEARRRISDSLETAVREGNGEAFVEITGDGTERILVSLSGACPACGTSYPALEPRTFSFNSPFGACEACEGLGHMYEGDEDLIVHDRSRSLLHGAIAPWTGMAGGYQRWALEAFCRSRGIDMRTPWKDLAAKDRKVLLDGIKGEIETTWRGKTYSIRYEGVRPWLKRRLDGAKDEKQREMAAQYMREIHCTRCEGRRLAPYPLAVEVGGTSIADVASMSVEDARAWFDHLELTEQHLTIAARLLRECRARLSFLCDVGLSYITLDRSAKSLSGGEAQRIRLASQIGAGLAGVLYVLDEPSIGLHPRDNERLVGTLEHLRDLGNTVLVVEHDEETMRSADWIIEIGPRAGVDGGRVVVEGSLEDVTKCAESLTGAYLSRRIEILTPKTRRVGRGSIDIVGASENNLRDIDVSIPLGGIVSVAGVSGSGKSTLVSDILHPAVARVLHNAKTLPGKHKRVDGLEQIDKAIVIDQSPIGRTPRSNPATYTGVFDKIRTLFGELPESKARGWKQGRYSFNVPVSNGGGRCEGCEGDGQLTIEMNFLPDIHVPCETCQGRRYNDETLEVKFKNKSIADVLAMTVDEARETFAAQPSIKRVLDCLHDVGLGYVALGQAATTLSGGEAQRVKLAEQLSKRSTGKTLYILDEPTTGLHFADVHALLDVLQRLADGGNTVLVVEHNIDVLRVSDHVIELGPEGGKGGGLVVAAGTPEEVAMGKSATAGFLKEALDRHGWAEMPARTKPATRGRGDKGAGPRQKRGVKEATSGTTRGKATRRMREEG